jgi:hypothetical protein
MLRLVFTFRYGRLTTGIVIFALLWSGLAALSQGGDPYLRLFFTAIVAYIIPITSLILERTVTAYDEIDAALDVDAAQRQQSRRALTDHSGRWYRRVTALAVVLWLCHMSAIGWAGGLSPLEVLLGRQNLAGSLGSLLVWLTLTTAISALISNAYLFAALGKQLHIDLLRTELPITLARVAVVSTLSIVGAQILFVFLILDADSDWFKVLPGFITTTVPMLMLFLVPVMPLHRRLQSAKQEELAAIDQELAILREDDVVSLKDAPALDQLNRLLSYRREIRSVSVWPFDVPALTRLGLYLILPPLTWVGAALIENLVDALL